MLTNFLEALDITGASQIIKRVILATGAKQYSVHFSPVKNPMEESDPWIEGPDRPLIFTISSNVSSRRKPNSRIMTGC